MRRLFRSKKDSMICGVCGGLAEYFNVDPAIVRLATVALFLVNPAVMIILYIVACVVIPEKKEEAPPTVTPEEGREGLEVSRREFSELAKVLGLVVGVILIVAGAVAIASAFIPPAWFWGVIRPVFELPAYLARFGSLVYGVVLLVLGGLLLSYFLRHGRK